MPSQLRPILTSLNADSSWLISLPRPSSDRAKKAYYHVVTDPWLSGSAEQWFSGLRFLHMMLPAGAGVPDVPAIESVIREIESSAGNPARSGQGQDTENLIDAIFISFLASDHCHVPTLLSFGQQVPVYTAASAASKIEATRHFNTVIRLKPFDGITDEKPSWEPAHPGRPLPEWLSVLDLTASGIASFCLAIITSAEPDQRELILFTPHGILPTEPSLQALLHTATPQVQTLALMHPLKEYWSFGMKAILGARNGLALVRESRARYWVNTSDGMLQLSGLISWLGTDVARTLQWGIEEDKKAGITGEAGDTPNFVEVENGKRFVLT